MARSRRDDDLDDDDDRDERPQPRKKRRVDEPEPVRGEVIPTSKLKIFGLMLVGLAFFVVCSFLLYDGLFVGEEKTVLPFRLTWWGYILVVIGFGLGVFCTIAGVMGFFIPTQLVFGKTMFQEQIKSGEKWEVILQIPFDAIRKVKFETYDNDTHIGIKFEDPDDPDIYCKDETAFETAKGKGWDYILDGLYTVSLKDIAAKLQDRVDE
jgi:hypothetical protein